MEDAHLGSTGQDGVVDEVLHLHQRLVAPHAAQVDFRAEMLDVGIDRAPRDVARRRVGLEVGQGGLRAARGGAGLRLLCALQAVEAHLRPHAAAEDDHCHLAVQALHRARARQSLDAHGVALVDRQLALDRGPHLGLLLLLRSLLGLPLLVALLATADALDLGLEVLVAHHAVTLRPLLLRRGRCLLVQSALKLGELLADLARFLFLGLVLADLADGVLDALVALLDQFLGLGAGTGEDLLAALLHVLHHRLVFLQPLLQFLLAGVDGLPLRLPVALVAHDVLQVLVALDIV